ncbi:MAG TPA: type VI secretion system-associated FHA domain protein TagH [Burkholderiaceae bacterium]|nr:type VI secretion system-associated FHA domain protein TagH [Burkholderiaceae bacterium]
MNLVLRALTLNDQPLSQAIVGCFDVKGGTIGRSDTNTMTLPDSERHISRLQAEVIAQEGHFVVRNAASANAIFVNGRALGPGERSVLANHDELRIGGYVLGVEIEADNAVVRTITHGRAVVDARAVIVGSAAEHRTDPRQMAQGRDAARGAAPLSQPPLPDDSDPFANLAAAPAGAGSKRAPTPPQVGAPLAPTTSVAAAAVEPDALWAAFCEGAGVRVNLPQGLNPEQMRIVGQVMREAVEGALHLMSVRATAKTELRAAVTTIRAKNNNPLKFSPNARSALEQLLKPPLRGFMAGPVAMRDAMHDLVGHSIGTMAGMRAALAGVLARFEPGQLERKLADRSVIDSLLPMNRKAKLWDLYLQHFHAIHDEAQDDFHNLFGAAFVAAYEDQLDRLQPPARDDAGT